MSENKMLIDATHPEETRVVVLRGGRVEEFDYESAARKQLRGNIYLAKVTRVEPALQAAFVDYGGNRHGFLAFNEIHPDYYQIPIADRIALLEEEAAIEAEEEAEADARAERMAARRNRRQGQSSSPNGDDDDHSHDDSDEPEDIHAGPTELVSDDEDDDDWHNDDGVDNDDDVAASEGEQARPETGTAAADDATGAQSTGPRTIAIDTPRDETVSEEPSSNSASAGPQPDANADQDAAASAESGSAVCDHDHSDASAPKNDDDVDASGSASEDSVENVGEEDALEELPSRPRRSRRSYKIQEVIKRRQVLLIQVVKEERGNKGAALTTYLSLAGRYTVLMPNTARGGGISRKITNPQDRKRLKAIATELEVPEGMGLIIRTAGAARTKQEIRRDFEYLLRLWESVRELTLQSTAPSLVYEEGDLIKRSIRDLYNKEIDEVIVAGDDAHREAKSFMRMLMPSHAKNVTLYKESEPLFTRFGIERQLNAMFSPFVTLRSGGYLVINQTEALVAVDVNSGRSTREFSIEETALHTNLEAADEIARHLKLRDLAGLIVIDFIDMEEKRNNRAVERRLKDALRLDRARIQIGRISPFGLLEMSRQRLRTGVLEGSTSQCPHCQGTGIIRSTESIALAVLRALEDAVLNKSRGSLIANTTAEVALYILNNKRDFIIAMETRHGFPILVQSSDKMAGANFTVEKGPVPAQAPAARRTDRIAIKMDWTFDEADEADDEAEELVEVSESDSEEVSSEEHVSAEEDSNPRKRRRRRRGRRNGERSGADDEMNGHDSDVEAHADGDEDDSSSHHDEDSPDAEDAAHAGEAGDAEGDSERPSRRRRRGRRGGRRNRERSRTSEGGTQEEGEETYAAAIPGLGPQPLLSEIASEPANGALPEQQQPAAEPTSTPAPAAPAAVVDKQEAAPLASTQPETTAKSVAPEVVVERPVERAPEPAAEPAASVSTPVPSPAAPDAVPAAKVAEPVESAKSIEPTEGPRLQRVIISPNAEVATEDVSPAADEKPVRKGWWQRKLMGSDS